MLYKCRTTVYIGICAFDSPERCSVLDLPTPQRAPGALLCVGLTREAIRKVSKIVVEALLLILIGVVASLGSQGMIWYQVSASHGMLIVCTHPLIATQADMVGTESDPFPVYSTARAFKNTVQITCGGYP